MRIVTLLALCALLCCSEGHEQEECLNQHNPLPVKQMIKDMIDISQGIDKSLAKDNKTHKRILFKKCFKKLNVADFKRILEIYDKHVFQKMWKSNRIPQSINTFMDSFQRLKSIMEICKTKSTQTPCGSKNLRRFENTLMKLQPEDHIKALSEFRTVLVWMSYAMEGTN